MDEGRIVISRQAVARLVLIQSIMSGLNVIAAAAILADVIGAKPAALFVVLVAGGQTALQSYMSKTVGETTERVEHAVAHAENVADRAETMMTQVAEAAGMSMGHDREGNDHGRPPV